MSLRSWCLRLAMFAAAAGVCAAASFPASATPVLAADRVLAVLGAAHLPVQSAEIEFLAPVVLHRPAAILRIANLERWQDSAVARIYCANTADCLPFFVVVHWSDPREREAALGPSRRAPKETHVAARAEPAKPVLVRAGQPATMLLENGKMRIATPMICLQNGSQGQKIRVTSLDHKRIVLAEVVDLGMLKGSL